MTPLMALLGKLLLGFLFVVFAGPLLYVSFIILLMILWDAVFKSGE